MREFLDGDYTIGKAITKDGKTVAQDIHLLRGEKPYVITIATRRFLRHAQKHNRRLPQDDPARINERVLILRDVSDENEILEELSRVSFEGLRPYLIEQKVKHH